MNKLQTIWYNKQIFFAGFYYWRGLMYPHIHYSERKHNEDLEKDASLCFWLTLNGYEWFLGKTYE